MKSLRVLFVLVIIMMNGINAMDNSHHINLDKQYFTGNCTDKEGRTLLHLLARYCGSDDKVTVTFCPAEVEEQAIRLGIEQFFSSEEKIKEFIIKDSKNFIINNFVRFSRIKDGSGETPLDILNKRPCDTKLCKLLKKQLNRAAGLNAADAKILDLMEDLER